MDATEKGEILDAIRRVEDRLVQKARDDEARFAELEEDIREDRGALKDLSDQIGKLTTGQLEMLESYTRVVNASAAASEISLKALRAVEDSADATTKMIAGAMTVQQDAIKAAVGEVVAPLAAEVDTLKANDVAQNEQFGLVLASLATLAKWQNHWVVKIAVFVGALAAGWYAKTH